MLSTTVLLRPHPLGLLLATLLTVTGCTPGEREEDARDATAPSAVPLHGLTAEPLLEIGALAGDPDYLFDEIVSVRRLPAGGVAVADAGAVRVSLFDDEGRFLRAFGSRGEGPGEMRALGRIYVHGPDSLLAADAFTGVVSAFDTAGAFGRQIARSELSGDSLFGLDVWLYGPFWVEGPLTAEQRGAAAATLDRLPVPGAEPPRPAYRRVLAGADGELWVREPGATSGGDQRWTVVSSDAAPLRVVEIPEAFSPMDIRRDEVLGRWRGENDVNFVRAYGVQQTGERVPAPPWLASPGSSGTAASTAPGATAGEAAPSDPESYLPHIRSAVKQMASAQEIGYARRGSYTSRVDSLEMELDEGVLVDVVEAHNRGWSGVFGHETGDRICGLGYGSATPPGWRGGMVTCSHPRGTFRGVSRDGGEG